MSEKRPGPQPDLHPDTIAVSAGRPPEAPGAPINQPPVLSSVLHRGSDFDYGRAGNPTWTALETALGALEGGHAVAFSSGMAASAAVIGIMGPGIKILAAEDAYYGNRNYLKHLDEGGTAKVTSVDISDTDATLGLADGIDLLWLESPSNPKLRIADIETLAAGAHERGAKVLVDGTFTSPILQQALSLGADLVLHSISKYISGHSDVVMGAVIAPDTGTADRLRQQREMTGGIPGPMETFLALRGLRTLPLRIERAQANAIKLARRLVDHPRVERVLYPGLETHPGYEIARKQMSGPGAMLSFLVDGDGDAAEAVCARVRVIEHVTSLGGVETTIERRARYAGETGTPENLLRMSVGIENLEDLWTDLNQALTE